MSNNVKSRFSGFLRGLLRKLDDSDPAAPETPRPLTRPLPNAEPAAAPQSQAMPEQTEAAGHAPAPAATTTTNPDELEMPLLSILGSLPMDLRAKIVQMPAPGATLIVPVEKVLSQLAHGSVRITFGELRIAAPTIFVKSGGENDSRPVTLPLNEILSRLNPTLLRRNTQKRIEVSEEISGPFGAGAQGISFTTAPLKAPSPSKAPAPAPVRSDKSMEKPAAPLPPPPAFTPPPRATAPSAPIPFTARPAAPTAAEKNGSDIRDIFAPAQKIAAPNLPPPSPAAAPSAAASGATIQVPLKALMESWPDNLKKEVMQSNLLNARIALPVNLVEPGMKRGRISMTWKNLRALIQPAPPIVSIHDGIELELPLKVIAPLFFAAQKSAPRAQQKLSVSEEIPNLFFGFPQPQESPSVAPAMPPAQPPKPATDIFLRKNAAPGPQAPASLPKEIADTDVFLRKGDTPPPPALEISPVEFKPPAAPGTDFMSRYATPAQIVERALEIPGVAGAVVALPDGLKVASEVRSSMNADTIAAFLPQIIARVNQCTRELRMGDLNHLSFLVGMVQWEIFRVGGVFLAVFGDLNETLPSAQLAQLAAQLERKK
ncbi:MAG TPA: roadblock/LC7 domain-containing protein [Verrucomicrobiae bacterium]|nr:roadblock/LC7 domain-containing protein [Verrucomicrobiae bacterium]